MARLGDVSPFGQLVQGCLDNVRRKSSYLLATFGSKIFHFSSENFLGKFLVDFIDLCHAIVQADGRGLHLCHASQGLVL